MDQQQDSAEIGGAESDCVIEQPVSPNQTNVIILFDNSSGVTSLHVRLDRCSEFVENVFFNETALHRLYQLREESHKPEEHLKIATVIMDFGYPQDGSGGRYIFIKRSMSMEEYEYDDSLMRLYGLRDGIR